MAANEPTAARKPMTITGLVFLIIVGLLIVATGTIAGFRLMMEWPAINGAKIAPTAIIALTPQSIAPQRPLTDPAAAPALPGIAQNAATAQALFDAAVRAGETVPNVGQSEPVILQSKPVERMPAGENVPTAEPLVENSGIFGSKPAVVDVQGTQQCKHGQIWTARGCKNPTPTGAP